MAASDKGAAPSKQHVLHLSNGGAALIKNMVMQANWYEGQPIHVGLAGAQVGENLSEVAQPVPDDQVTTPAHAKQNESWMNLPKEVEVSEKEREALKICLRFFYKKGALRLTKHVRALFVELGLADE